MNSQELFALLQECGADVAILNGKYLCEPLGEKVVKAFADAIESQLKAQVTITPLREGWVSVPREPTEAMCNAGADSGGYCGWGNARAIDVYKAMIAVSEEEGI